MKRNIVEDYIIYLSKKEQIKKLEEENKHPLNLTLRAYDVLSVFEYYPDKWIPSTSLRDYWEISKRVIFSSTSFDNSYYTIKKLVKLGIIKKHPKEAKYRLHRELALYYKRMNENNT